MEAKHEKDGENKANSVNVAFAGVELRRSPATVSRLYVDLYRHGMTMSKRGLETPFEHGLNCLLAQAHTQAVRQYEDSLGVQQLRPRPVSSVPAGGEAQSWDQQVLPTLGRALYPGKRHRKEKGYGG
jgi:hypothetical protein